MSPSPSVYRPHGGYRRLRSFAVTQAIYDATVLFCDRFVDRRSRTRDQMVQAARSGRQNIAEGSRASATSARSEMKLVTVARASLDELLLDYEDFLRQRGLPLWDKDHPRSREVRALGMKGRKQSSEKDRTDRSDQTDRSDSGDPLTPYRPFVAEGDPETAANTIICLVHQANYLLDRQLAGLERQFMHDGGFSERLTSARVDARAGQPPAEVGGRNQSDRSDQTDRSDQAKNPHLPAPSAPACPSCGKAMVLRTARKGPHAGRQFWGCSTYPECTGTRPVPERQGPPESGGGP